MSDLLFFDELGAELERVARLNGGRRPFRAGHRVSVVAVIVAVLLLAGIAAAAVLLIRQGKPLPAPPAGALGPDVQPVPGSVHLAGLDARDPAGGPPWDIRLSRSGTGETCSAVGQVVDGRFGIVGLDGVFRVLGLGGVDACGVPGVAGPVLAGARVFVGRSEAQARTVVNGVAGPEARSVTVYGPGGARRLRLGPGKSFITVYSGYVEDVRPRIEVLERNGRKDTIALASSYTLQTADPQGGPPWDVIGGADLTPGAYPDEQCTQLQQESAPLEPGVAQRPFSPGGEPPLIGPSTPQLCGRLGTAPLFVVIRRFDPGEQQNGQWYWWNNPPRTVVYGAASPRVASLTLKIGSATTRPLLIDRSDGAFAAVLDGHTDPRSLTLTAHLSDGTTVSYTRSTNLLKPDGKAVNEPSVPAYRSPTPVKPISPLRFVVPIADTVRVQLRAADPAGGPEWGLESWQGLPNPSALRHTSNASAVPKRFYCEEAGVIIAGKLVQQSADGQPTAVTDHEQDCDGMPSKLLVSAQEYVNDPDSYAPVPTRVVLTGFLPPGATDPLLLGDGSPKPLALDANGAFLAVLPGRFWDTNLHVSATLPDGKTALSGNYLQGTAAPLATAPDPDGGAPWGFRAGPNHFEMDGQVLDNRLVSIQPNGNVQPGPDELSQFGTGRLPAPSPLELFPQPSLSQVSVTLTQPEIERRTLPGSTLIAGLAAPAVVTVTITTPRDVRTLRPSGPQHAFIAVYDGYFYNSIVTVTA
ncbi:MAG: hypothetical protein ACLP8S_09030, partial [Solirubrobacteraceae bacterium]